MSRTPALTGATLIAAGLSLFLVKVLVYDLPVAPTDTRGMWQVEMRINARGEGRRGSVSALLPVSDDAQKIFDERSSSDRLDFSIRSVQGQRVGVWKGRLEDIHEVVYVFRVQSFGASVSLPHGPSAAPPQEILDLHGRPSPEFPAESPDIAEHIERLRLPGPRDATGRLRSLYAFVSHEIDTVETAGDDALLTLEQREGSSEGKERLLATLLRAAGVPARNVRGLELREGPDPEERIWTEAWVDGSWVPMSSTEGFFGERPPDLVALGSGDRELVEGRGVRAVGHRFRSLRERLRPAEVATLLEPANPILARVSLYRLPVATQSALRLLLLLPLGALIVAVFRNVIGIPTFGTFMPVLLAVALRGTSLTLGLVLVAWVLLLGVAGRLALERLRLLLVPRLSILLCLVVLTVTGLAVIGRDSGNGEMFAGVFFPIVILTMLVERFSITIAEEGLREALIRAGFSVLVAICIYPVFRSPQAEYLMFSFPELVVVIMGVLVLIGAYTGYRLSDFVRFRAFRGGLSPMEAR